MCFQETFFLPTSMKAVGRECLQNKRKLTDKIYLVFQGKELKKKKKNHMSFSLNYIVLVKYLF